VRIAGRHPPGPGRRQAESCSIRAAVLTAKAWVALMEPPALISPLVSGAGLQQSELHEIASVGREICDVRFSDGWPSVLNRGPQSATADTSIRSVPVMRVRAVA
jgi:hypothetical protein